MRHDKLVQQNWERFRNGLFKDILSDELKNHLEKFSERRPTLITLERKYFSTTGSKYIELLYFTITSIYAMIPPKKILTRPMRTMPLDPHAYILHFSYSLYIFKFNLKKMFLPRK